MLERPQSGERTILVHIDFGDGHNQDDVAEFQLLAQAAGADTLALITGHRKVPDPKYYIGEGKAEEIRQAVRALSVEVVLFNHSLSPAQERNLEKFFECRVLDRTELILDIFAQRARTFEGKLQVELAQLQHLATRLVRGWTHLERQKGGIGLRGPGETQLETDRRLIRDRIALLKMRLEKVRLQRQQGRNARHKAALPTVSLVGYTNAGKSTLFNRLTGAHVYVASQLFATLDPTLRTLHLPHIGKIVLADTVGFISHLPHKLVDAFRATLEETLEATLLLHVVDVDSENRNVNMKHVEAVLEEIGAISVPRLVVFNKIDNIPRSAPRIDRDIHGLPMAVWVSAKTGAGIPLLLQAIRERLSQDLVEGVLCIHPDEGKLRAELYALEAVTEETVDEEGCCWLNIRLLAADQRRLWQAYMVDSTSWNPKQ